MKKILFLVLIYIITGNLFSQWQPINSGVTSNLMDGCFTNDSTAFIVSKNGTILKTIDRGNTWNINTNLTGIFTSICHVGNDTIYAGGNCIYRSNDGGNTWNLVSNLTYTISDLGFLGSKNGFIIIPGVSSCSWSGGTSTSDYYTLYKSTDYGLTWQLLSADLDRASRIEIINDSTTYITASHITIQYHCVGSWTNDSKKTNNRGLSWFNVSQPYMGKSYVSFINDTVGYFIQAGNYSGIEKTSDGGTTIFGSYTEINDPKIDQCKFINEIDGYIKSKNSIYVTSSSGLGWTQDYISSDSINFLFKNPTNQFFAIGENGLILKKVLTASLYPDTVYRVKTNLDFLDFGYVNKDSLSTQPIHVKNTGNYTLNFSLNSSTAFKIGTDTTSFINNLNITLSSFQDTVIYVQFNPLQVQSYVDTLLITTNHMSPKKIPLSGTGFLGLRGNIIQDTLICVDTLRIGGNVKILNTAKVTICAGTYVKFLGDFKIEIEGILRALGDSLNPITFETRDTTSQWNGITLNNLNYSDTTIFNYCKINSNSFNTIILISNGFFVVNHCTISNAHPITYTGQIIRAINSHSKFILIKSQIFNTNTFGGSIHCDNCDSSSISECKIYNNGYAIWGFPNSYFKISNNEIYDNNDCIYAAGKVIIQNNKVFNNNVGVSVKGLDFLIENNQIFNNKYGGGIGINGGGPIRQNLIFNNDGGGINIYPNNGPQQTTTYITNNVVCNNLGNNIYATSNSMYTTDIKLFNNILYNTAPNPSDNIYLNPNYLVTTEIGFNCVNPSNGLGLYNISLNPNFISPTNSIGSALNLGNYNWQLQQNSPCINTGDSINNGYLLPLDFIGNSRIFGNRVDIGPFEYQGYYDAIQEYNSLSSMCYPNPFDKNLHVLINDNSPCEINIYDISSRILLKQNFTKSAVVNTEQFSRGVYIYEIKTSDGKSKKGKIIKL